MADLTESSQKTETTTPQYYTDYLSNLASKGTAAGAAVDYSAWNPNALQTSAFTKVASNVGDYLPGLTQAGTTFGQAGAVNIPGAANPYLTAGTSTSGLSQANPYLQTGAASNGAAGAYPYLNSGMVQNTGVTAASPYVQAGAAANGAAAANPYLYSGMSQNVGASAANPYLQTGAGASGLAAAQANLQAGAGSAADLLGSYFNPYSQNVVDQIKIANQQNIQQNLSPSITAGAVGSGQFGSQRGTNALALGIANANTGALGQQAAALQSGYSDALKAAQQQRANQLSAGQTSGTLQNQYAANQINAAQIAGNLQSDQAKNALNAGQISGTLNNQYGANQINAGQILGNLQSDQAKNAINAGQISGNLLNQYGANQINAGQIAGTLQNQSNTNNINAGQIAGNMAAQQGQLLRDVGTGQASLASQTQNQGLADVNALATLGAQQQTIGQNKAFAPLDVLGKQAAILSGANIPTTTTTTASGSPLSMISGLGALGLGASNLNTKDSTGKTLLERILSGIGLS